MGQKRRIMKIIALISVSLLGIVWFASKQGQEMKTEIHLIPKGFIGVVTIIHSQSGEIGATKNDSVYHIPNNGILLTQKPLKAKIKDIKYYYGDRQNPLEYVWDFKSKERTNNDTIYVYGGSTGTYGQNGKEVDCTTYIVGTLNDLDSLSNALNKIKPLELIKK